MTKYGLKFPVFAFILFVIFHLISCENKSQNEILRVAVAANARLPLEEIAKKYQKKTGQEVEISVASSGKLTTQIEMGAPFDVFFSADTSYPEYLSKYEFTHHIPVTYAVGTLILLSSKKSHCSLGTLKDCEGKFAIANPVLAPYGKASVQVLSKIDSLHDWNEKIVTGENIAQVAQFVTTGVVNSGFTALSVYHSLGKDSVRYRVEIVDKTLYDPIYQNAVVLENRTEMQERASRFLEYVLSAEGLEVLNYYGYIAPPTSGVK